MNRKVKSGRNNLKWRADSKLGVLPAERRAEIAAFAESHTLAETVVWLADQGISVAASSVSKFLIRYQLIRQLDDNALTVQTLIAALARHDRKISPERLQALGQIFFGELALAKRDPRLWYLAQQIELRRERLQLDRQKHQEQVESRKAEADPPAGGITPETLEQIEQEIKLM
jgi:hypothetical protein